MNKEKFMLTLEKKLKKLPDEERKAALTYYEEYFAEAGKENESQVIEELGDVSQIASQIMANFVVKQSNSMEDNKNFKHSISIVWLIILAIFASPIALPIALVLIVLILITWIIIITFWICGFVLILTGIIYGILCIFVLFHDISLACLMLGCSMVVLGLGIAIMIGFSNLFISYSSWITKKLGKLLLRKEKKNEK